MTLKKLKQDVGIKSERRRLIAGEKMSHFWDDNNVNKNKKENSQIEIWGKIFLMEKIIKEDLWTEMT